MLRADRWDIGGAGTGALHVSGGAKVLFDPETEITGRCPSAGIRIGARSNGAGVVTVSDPGSEIEVRGKFARMEVGGSSRNDTEATGTGTMVITNGGMVIHSSETGSAVTIAKRPPNVGLVRVEGVGTVGVTNFPSTLDAGPRLCVGLGSNCTTPGGIATLIVADGGVVNAVEMAVGPQGLVTGSGGTINVGGATLTNGGIIKPINNLTINGRFIQTPAGTTVLRINGTEPGEFDQLILNGPASLEGKIEIVVSKDVSIADSGTVDVLVGDIENLNVEVTVTEERSDTTRFVTIVASNSDGLTVDISDGNVVGVGGVSTMLDVGIDIKPGGEPNSINFGSNGNVPVAILSTRTFDAATVDPTSVTLANATVKLKGNGTTISSLTDVNGDGLLDLVVHIDTTALQLTGGSVTATVNGELFDGTPIEGTDSVNIVP